MFATTYDEAFNWPKRTTWGIKKWPKDRYIEPENNEQKSPLYRNSETLMQLTKECLTPFDYLLTPKPILQTIPSQPFCLMDLPKDDGSARFTRPRVYKAPEISLDDIEDPQIRDKIIDYTYSTTWGLASKDAATKITKRQIPDSAWEQPYHWLQYDRNTNRDSLSTKDIISLQVPGPTAAMQRPNLLQILFNKKEDSIEKECEGVLEGELSEWEKAQSRALADPTATFWQQFRNQAKVKLMDQDIMDIKSPEYTRQILCLARQQKLRFPYKLKPPNYAGFMPEFPVGIEPKKEELEFSDPMITVYQLANRWAEK